MPHKRYNVEADEERDLECALRTAARTRYEHELWSTPVLAKERSLTTKLRKDYGPIVC